MQATVVFFETYRIHVHIYTYIHTHWRRAASLPPPLTAAQRKTIQRGHRRGIDGKSSTISPPFRTLTEREGRLAATQRRVASFDTSTPRVDCARTDLSPTMIRVTIRLPSYILHVAPCVFALPLRETGITRVREEEADSLAATTVRSAIVR